MKTLRTLEKEVKLGLATISSILCLVQPVSAANNGWDKVHKDSITIYPMLFLDSAKRSDGNLDLYYSPQGNAHYKSKAPWKGMIRKITVNAAGKMVGQAATAALLPDGVDGESNTDAVIGLAKADGSFDFSWILQSENFPSFDVENIWTLKKDGGVDGQPVVSKLIGDPIFTDPTRIGYFDSVTGFGMHYEKELSNGKIQLFLRNPDDPFEGTIEISKDIGSDAFLEELGLEKSTGDIYGVFSKYTGNDRKKSSYYMRKVYPQIAPSTRILESFGDFAAGEFFDRPDGSLGFVFETGPIRNHTYLETCGKKRRCGETYYWDTSMKSAKRLAASGRYQRDSIARSLNVAPASDGSLFISYATSEDVRTMKTNPSVTKATAVVLPPICFSKSSKNVCSHFEIAGLAVNSKELRLFMSSGSTLFQRVVNFK